MKNVKKNYCVPVRGCFGKAILAVIKESKVSLREVSRRTGIPSGNLSKMTRGLKNIEEHQIEKILLALNKSSTLSFFEELQRTDFLKIPPDRS